MLIVINPDDSRPIYQQIIDQIKEQIMNGLLQPGDELPSVRDLANGLAINMHTVHKAYQELKSQNVVIMRLGQKVRIAPLLQSASHRAETDKKLKEDIRRLMVDAFHYGYSNQDLLQLFMEQLKHNPSTLREKEPENENQ